MKLVEVDCPVCGSDDYYVTLPDTLGAKPPVFGYKLTPEFRNSYRAVRCRRCSHMYSSPRLENMYAYYKDVSDEVYFNNAPLRAASAKKVIAIIRKIASGGKLLDVGCSMGDFLKEAREYYQVEGLELSDWAADLAEKSGLRVHRTHLEKIAKNGPAYDVVTMWGVIEHFENPRLEMDHIRKILNPNGIVCFWTGDSNSLPARILGRHWWFVIGQHIQFFTRRSIDRLMTDSGFEYIAMHTYPYVISLKYLGTSLSRYPALGSIANWIFKSRLLRDRTITLRLPGEMLGIYRIR